MDAGVLIMSGLKDKRVLESVDIVTKQVIQGKYLPLVDDYNSQFVSPKVVRIIQSYTDYINRTVWKKI